MVTDFATRGWAEFVPEPATRDWAQHAHRDAGRAVADPDLAHWFQCQKTWFVGLEALDNDSAGRVGSSAPLSGQAVDFIAKHCGGWPPLHRAQISVVYPGYPKRRSGESDAAARYRHDRDAAHVDGILGIGSPKRRFVREPHAFILGLPLSQADPGAAPLVVWDGSHRIMQRALGEALTASGANDLSEVDVTDVYVAARKQVFETCPRVELPGAVGAAVVLHRLSLHGVAPWQPGAQAAPEGRMIAYFRPLLPGGVRDWIERD